MYVVDNVYLKDFVVKIKPEQQIYIITDGSNEN